MKKTKAEEFLQLFYYWSGRLRLPYVESIKDNRIDCAAFVKCEYYQIYYNTKRLNKIDNFNLKCIVFHEISHLSRKALYKTKEEKILEEYKAEKFALKMLKKYYIKSYNTRISKKEVVGFFEILKEKWPIHYEAFKKIKEYKRWL